MPDPSFEGFVREALPGLTRYARALTGEVHAADDLVQTTLVKVSGAWRRVNRDGHPMAYARKTLFRTFVSWRRLHRHRDVGLDDAPDRAAHEAGFAAAEAREQLRAALARLPRLQRAVLVATYVADLPDEAIAEMLDRTLSGVRTLRRRGLIAVRAALGATTDPVTLSARIGGDR